MVSSGLLRRVALVRTDVSEEISASIRVTRIGELGTTQAATSNRRTLRRNGISSQRTSVLTRATRRNKPEDTILHSHRRENLKSYILHHRFQSWISQLVVFNLLLADNCSAFQSFGH
jgi:hypothetical protein